jgi:hypothetical protein
MHSTKARRLVLLAVAAALVSAVAAPAIAQQGCAPLKGTIIGHLRPFEPGFPPGLPGTENTDWDGQGGWYGWAYLQIGDQPAVSMLLIDHGIAGKEKKIKPPNFGGEEILTFRLPGSTDGFKMHGSFMAIAGQAPYLFAFNENGSIFEGEGQYTGARGWMTINGLFTLPPAETFIDPAHDPFLWIAQVNGLYCGAR